MECIFLGVMGSFLWYRNYVCKLVLVCFGAFGYILRFGKVQKNGVDTKFTRTCYRMKIEILVG